eukprot:m.165111 g.165111  ORF g.165111 m.165111 type:complete len:338 (+) comp14419_c0_seq3:918-1931(+)
MHIANSILLSNVQPASRLMRGVSYKSPGYPMPVFLHVLHSILAQLLSDVRDDEGCGHLSPVQLASERIIPALHVQPFLRLARTSAFAAREIVRCLSLVLTASRHQPMVHSVCEAVALAGHIQSKLSLTHRRCSAALKQSMNVDLACLRLVFDAESAVCILGFVRQVIGADVPSIHNHKGTWSILLATETARITVLSWLMFVTSTVDAGKPFSLLFAKEIDRVEHFFFQRQDASSNEIIRSNTCLVVEQHKCLGLESKGHDVCTWPGFTSSLRHHIQALSKSSGTSPGVLRSVVLECLQAQDACIFEQTRLELCAVAICRFMLSGVSLELSQKTCDDA